MALVAMRDQRHVGKRIAPHDWAKRAVQQCAPVPGDHALSESFPLVVSH
jgi:hypothetical protein